MVVNKSLFDNESTSNVLQVSLALFPDILKNAKIDRNIGLYLRSKKPEECSTR